MSAKGKPDETRKSSVAGSPEPGVAVGRSSGSSSRSKTRLGSGRAVRSAGGLSGGSGPEGNPGSSSASSTAAGDAVAPSGGFGTVSGRAQELGPHEGVGGVMGLVNYWNSLVDDWRRGGPHPGNRIPPLGPSERVIRQKEVDLLWGPEGTGKQLSGTELCNTLSAQNTHQVAVRMIDGALPRWTVYLMAYTFDREDVADALVRAARRGACVLCIMDRAMLVGSAGGRGGTRDMVSRAHYMAANGVVVRVYESDSVREDYEAVGRPVGGFKGILHAKALYIESENGLRCEFIIGSANWTTSTRANGEIGIHGVGHGEDVPLLRRRFAFFAMRSDPHEDALRVAHLRAAAAENTGCLRARSVQR